MASFGPALGFRFYETGGTACYFEDFKKLRPRSEPKDAISGGMPRYSYF
jgi:hypothetical protein